MSPQGRLIIIASPSGGGKSTVIRRFLAGHPDMIHSISCTTRPMRKDKADRNDYHFMDEETFRRWAKEGRFAEWAVVHDNLYGTPKELLDKAIKEGKHVLLDLDVVGSLNLKKMYGEMAVTIFILPPSVDELKKRLSKRGTDSKEAQELRLANALKELACKDKFDHQVINDDLERVCGEIEKILGLQV